MVSTGLLLYFGGGTLLFFFWAYGIYAFARDLKNRLVPAARQYLAGRRAKREQAEEERERAERERQLY